MGLGSLKGVVGGGAEVGLVKQALGAGWDMEGIVGKEEGNGWMIKW